MKKIVFILLSGFTFTTFAEEVTEGYWNTLKKEYTTALESKEKLMPLNAAKKGQAQQTLTTLESAQKAAINFKQKLLTTISKANEVIQRPTSSPQTINNALKTIQSAGDYLVKIENQIAELQQAINDINKQLERFK